LDICKLDLEVYRRSKTIIHKVKSESQSIVYASLPSSSIKTNQNYAASSYDEVIYNDEEVQYQQLYSLKNRKTLNQLPLLQELETVENNKQKQRQQRRLIKKQLIKQQQQQTLSTSSLTSSVYQHQRHRLMNNRSPKCRKVYRKTQRTIKQTNHHNQLQQRQQKQISNDYEDDSIVADSFVIEKDNEIESTSSSCLNQLPSPIPHLTERTSFKQQSKSHKKETATVFKKPINNNQQQSCISDSDYKTQSSNATNEVRLLKFSSSDSTTSSSSSSNASLISSFKSYRIESTDPNFLNPNKNHQKSSIPTEVAAITTTTTEMASSKLLSNEDEIKMMNEHMDACEKLLNLEEIFIETMQKGVQQYSRPLRHCHFLTGSASNHPILFQNIEKILAISEYQLNQLITQDDSMLLDMMFTTMGKLYENKMRMSCEAFDIYLNGIREAFRLLDKLVNANNNIDGSNNVTKFLADSAEDIDMSLKTFLLLPLHYVGEVFQCLQTIRDKTNPKNNDYICLNGLLASLSQYVDRANVVFDELNADLNKNPLRRTLREFSNKTINKSINNVSVEDDESLEDESYLVYSSSLLFRLSSHKWKRVEAVLLSDALLLMPSSCNSTDLSHLPALRRKALKVIPLEDILRADFSSSGGENQFEFTYASHQQHGMHALLLRASSIEEKLTWKKLFSKTFQRFQC
jgi:hypothetical protein